MMTRLAKGQVDLEDQKAKDLHLDRLDSEGQRDKMDHRRDCLVRLAR